jgi:hypothetical protein
LFDSVENGAINAIINLCDCFGNISSPNSIEIRVRYPGSYAADRITKKGDLHKLGTISHSLENNTLVLNAYINDNKSAAIGALFDPTLFLACMYQVKDALTENEVNNILISLSSFIKFGIDTRAILGLIENVSNNLGINIIVTV